MTIFLFIFQYDRFCYELLHRPCMQNSELAACTLAVSLRARVSFGATINAPLVGKPDSTRPPARLTTKLLPGLLLLADRYWLSVWGCLTGRLLQPGRRLNCGWLADCKASWLAQALITSRKNASVLRLNNCLLVG